MNPFLPAQRVTNKQGVCLSEPVTTGGEVSFPMKYKTPQEAGIARFVPTPKQDRRTGPKPKQIRRYIITKKDRPDLFPL